MGVTASGIVVPETANGLAIQTECGVCGAKFTGDEREKWQRHVAKCARKNHEDLEKLAQINRERNPLHRATDHEALEYQRKRYNTGR